MRVLMTPEIAKLHDEVKPYLDDKFQAAYKWEDFKKNSDGMVPVIVQDYRTQEVLMNSSLSPMLPKI